MIEYGEVGVARRRWGLRFAAGLGVLAVLVSGCTEKQPANDTLPATSSSAPSESAEALPPLGPEDFPMPDEARTKDAAGVEAFTRYYLDLINRTSQVMESEYLRSFSDGCSTCNRIASDTESDAARGYRYRGGEITVTSVAPASVVGAQGEIAFTADQAALTVVDGDGRAVEGLSFEALPNLSSGAAVRWDAGRECWVMTQLTLG